MRNVDRKSWFWVFGVMSLLIVLQVVWWAYVFLKGVDRERGLALQLAAYERPSHMAEVRESLDDHSFRQRVMFLSESVFFVVLSLAGTILLFRFVRREQYFKEIQRNFIEIMSHESKTPLTALKLRLESIAERRPHDTELGNQVRSALSEVRRLIALFNKSMSLHRMEEMTLEPLSVNELLRDILHQMEPVIRDRKVNLKLTLEGEPFIQGDPHGLQNTFQSLIENAVLYNNAPDKTVSVSVHKKGGQVCIRVADNGDGVLPEEREKIFERFFRGKSGRGVPGTGLGLYLAKRIVESHSGVIRLIEEFPKGSAFEVLLPEYG